MPFEIQQINPLDQQPSVGIGVGLPFSSNSVFNTTYSTQDALKSNLINYFLTGTSERFLNPNLGAGLRALLFDQMTEDKKDEIKTVIRSGVAQWFPNINIQNLQVVEDLNSQTMTISIRYNVRLTNIQDELSINFQQ
jgi:phage baseplate assembly protein W